VIGIQNQPGTTLMTISDLTDIDAEVKVAEADVLRLAVGQPATVLLEAIPGRRFPGKVVEIGASALQPAGATAAAAAAREFRVVVRLDSADVALRPGLTCDAEILTEERRNVLTVPLQAVVLRPSATAAAPGAGAAPGAPAATDAPAGAGGTSLARPGEQAGVFVVDGDRARFRPVETGIIGGLDVEVRGVERGAEVVAGPYQTLRELQDGGRIRR
ncbi:MAG: efflux RND transporter periplasmic adaptor subunit, partial [Vicinamibacteraceae bacterium]|nr:efflux RND transporter periplasmic adaptor subunit [Vicinamibacteraceae bacterium]